MQCFDKYLWKTVLSMFDKMHHRALNPTNPYSHAYYSDSNMADVENPLHDKKNFTVSHGITSEEARRLLQIHGKNELPEKNIPKW